MDSIYCSPYSPLSVSDCFHLVSLRNLSWMFRAYQCHSRNMIPDFLSPPPSCLFPSVSVTKYSHSFIFLAFFLNLGVFSIASVRACYLLPCVNWVLVASPPGSKHYKHSTVCVCCMCICIQYHKYVHVGQPSVPLGDSAGSKLTNFCSPARLFSLSLPSLLTPSVFHSLAHSYSLSLSLCLLRQIVFITTFLRSQPRLQ